MVENFSMVYRLYKCEDSSLWLFENFKEDIKKINKKGTKLRFDFHTRVVQKHRGDNAAPIKKYKFSSPEILAGWKGDFPHLIYRFLQDELCFLPQFVGVYRIGGMLDRAYNYHPSGLTDLITTMATSPHIKEMVLEKIPKITHSSMKKEKVKYLRDTGRKAEFTGQSVEEIAEADWENL